MLVALISGLSVYALVREGGSDTAALGCDQSVTTTDCSRVAELYPAAPIRTEPEPQELEEIEWREYVSEELGIKFSYPTKSASALGGRTGDGTTGKYFVLGIPLPSGIGITAYALTKDFSVEKSWPGVSAQGFVVRDGKYYIMSKGSASDRAFVPDDIWKLHSGDPVPVVYGKSYYDVYPEPFVKAMVNTKHPIFPGITFVINNEYLDSRTMRHADQEDINDFQRIISSIEFIR